MPIAPSQYAIKRSRAESARAPELTASPALPRSPSSTWPGASGRPTAATSCGARGGGLRTRPRATSSSWPAPTRWSARHACACAALRAVRCAAAPIRRPRHDHRRRPPPGAEAAAPPGCGEAGEAELSGRSRTCSTRVLHAHRLAAADPQLPRSRRAARRWPRGSASVPARRWPTAATARCGNCLASAPAVPAAHAHARGSAGRRFSTGRESRSCARSSCCAPDRTSTTNATATPPCSC